MSAIPSGCRPHKFERKLLHERQKLVEFELVEKGWFKNVPKYIDIRPALAQPRALPCPALHFCRLLMLALLLPQSDGELEHA